MSCHDTRGRHRDETLRNSTIARLLLHGKLQEDGRPPPMDLSFKKPSENESKNSSFCMKELLNGSQSTSHVTSGIDSKTNEPLTFHPSNSEVTSEDKNSSSHDKDVAQLRADSRRVNSVPDSLADSISKLPSFIVMDHRTRSQGCSEALRSLLLKPSALLSIKNSSLDVQVNRTRFENGIPDNVDIHTRCDFAEFAKYFNGRDKLTISRALNQTNRARNCCMKMEDKFTSCIKQEDNYASDVKRDLGVVNKDNRVICCKNNEVSTDAKQCKVKRKIKTESPEYSSGSNSTPEPHVIPNQKQQTSLLKLHYNNRSPIEGRQSGFEDCKEEVKADDVDNYECDYDTFRKFKRFRKCLPAPLPDPAPVGNGGCQCNLTNLIQEIKSGKRSTVAVVDASTQCLRNLSDASTQYDIPTEACMQKVVRFDSESENGVTEGISMTGEGHLKCFHCGITFEDDVIHSIHMGCHCHRDPFICNLCGRQCDNKYVFNTHILRGHQPI